MCVHYYLCTLLFNTGSNPVPMETFAKYGRITYLRVILFVHFCVSSIHVTANLRNQIFPGIPNPFRESGESLKLISSKSNVYGFTNLI